MKSLIISILSALLVTGCIHTNTLRVIEDESGNSRVFRGIVDIIDQPGNTNVLFIHGMGGYSSNGGKIDPCHVINDVRDAYGLKPATFNVPQWHCDNTFNTGGKTIHLRSMHWSDITFTRKNSLQHIDATPTFLGNRAAITRQVKENLINHGFSDAVMYTGVFRQKIINRVIESYAHINQVNPDAKVVIVAFSLGSAIMMDSLKQLEKLNKVDLLKEKVEMIYMMANQIPLVQTGTEPLSTLNKEYAFKDGFYTSLIPYLSKKDKVHAVEEIRIVAFSDPNDLLSYPLDNQNMGELRSKYVNVAISVADKTFYVPFYKEKSSVVNYLKAHTGYVYNKSIKKLLLNGNHGQIK